MNHNYFCYLTKNNKILTLKTILYCFNTSAFISGKYLMKKWKTELPIPEELLGKFRNKLIIIIQVLRSLPSYYSLASFICMCALF